MIKDFLKRIIIQIIIYLCIFYFVPIIANLCGETMEIYISAIFIVILNLLICIIIGTIDSYKYKINYYLMLLPGLLFLPTIKIFNYSDLYIYSLIYSLSYGIGILLGWSYKTYGYQLKQKKN